MEKKRISGRVRAKTRCFVGNVLHEEGDEFDYDGPENGVLELVDKGGGKDKGKGKLDDSFLDGKK